MKKIIALAFLVFIIGCKDHKKSEYETKVNTEGDDHAIETVFHSGKKLMETNCYVCHGPETPEQSRVAPPMVAIKAAYINENRTKEAFIDEMLAFLNKPTEEKTKLRGAVRQFGVMPYQHFPEKTIRQIADYMYDYQIEEPEWFNEHWARGHGKSAFKQTGKKATIKEPVSTTDYEKKGLEYALATKQELGKNLMGTIKKKGTLEAVSFCNGKAYPITDSMSTVQGVRIKRVSDKPRNPNNQANDVELKHIETFKALLGSGKEISPIVEKQNDKTHFYYPIVTNTMCMQCHGTPQKQIVPEVFASIQKLYADDKAIGYDINEVRGIWNIQFKE